MKLFVLALLPFAAQAWEGQKCYRGTIKIGDNVLTEGDIMAGLENQVNASVFGSSQQ